MATLPAGWKPAAAGLAGRTVLIVGATGGLGRASALACAEAGATVVLLGRKVPALEKLYDEIEALGAPAPAIYPLNLEGATPADYDELATVIARECGGLDGIVHAAAHFAGLQPLGQVKPEEWMRVLQVNLNGPFLLTQALLPLLLQSPDASIVFVEDDTARVRRSFWGAYGVAKAAQSGLAAILHDETENTSVRVASLLPPPMRTALRRMAYFGENTLDRPEPADFAAAVVYLLGRDGAAARGDTLDLRSTH
ncbi:MAG: short-chain dehydrogenase [Lysobacterales bacterium 69-70]|nr:SDR family NAD(P)-dependent oxidoreductase [Xanthomonadaceae bacterium]ODU36174.1 MAG: short-chain dehydrogenase [Xanthomonadaceae bacterium SCN 69-320]ODV17560.1 MAG: short-chain dehydrogenase [Xanthomonadaceae bacterium SCN 69-25]OJY99368.1 MAG: short-chain dehydrogenase [Xanthomonadales bacterium 69-70]